MHISVQLLVSKLIHKNDTVWNIPWITQPDLEKYIVCASFFLVGAHFLSQDPWNLFVRAEIYNS